MLDRPDKLNALTPEMLDQLGDGRGASPAVATRGSWSSAAPASARSASGADINRFADLTRWRCGATGPSSATDVFDAPRRGCASRRSPSCTATRSAAGSSSRSPCDFRVVADHGSARAARGRAGHRPRLGRHRAARRARRPGPGQGGRRSARRIARRRDGTHLGPRDTAAPAAPTSTDAVDELVASCSRGAPVAVAAGQAADRRRGRRRPQPRSRAPRRRRDRCHRRPRRRASPPSAPARDPRRSPATDERRHDDDRARHRPLMLIDGPRRRRAQRRDASSAEPGPRHRRRQLRPTRAPTTSTAPSPRPAARSTTVRGRRCAGAERARVLLAPAELIRRDAEELARTEALEMRQARHPGPRRGRQPPPSCGSTRPRSPATPTATRTTRSARTCSRWSSTSPSASSR